MNEFACSNCGATYPKWVGQCSVCKEWNTIIEEKENTGALAESNVGDPVSIADINTNSLSIERISSGFNEFDRVLGGGFVKGEVVLLSGDPGIGKSTLLMQTAISLADKNNVVVYVSAEESESQVFLRAKRISSTSSLPSSLYLLSAFDIDKILEVVSSSNPNFIIFDSIQMFRTGTSNGVAGSVIQVREVASLITHYAKSKEIPVIIVGHVTKGGDIAGPKILEHIVDTVVYLEGERYRDLRILKTMKNRFGPVEEVGIFSMEENGLKEVLNPSEVLLSDVGRRESGICSIAVMEGTRPLLLEVQALCNKSFTNIPRRVANGFDFQRLQMLCAVLEKKLKVSTSSMDVYANIVGGIQINEPSADLGLCLAIYSSAKNLIIPNDSVFIGEVGLAGEVRNVYYLDARLREAERLGYKKAYIGKGNLSLKKKSKVVINVVEVDNISSIANFLK